MKRARVLGAVAMILAAVVLLMGILGIFLRNDTGFFAEQAASAKDKEKMRVAANGTITNLQNAIRKVDISNTEAIKAKVPAREAAATIAVASDALSGAQTEDEIVALYLSVLAAVNRLEGSDAEIELVSTYQRAIDGDTLPMQKALSSVESAISDTQMSLGHLLGTVEQLLLSTLQPQMDEARVSVLAAEKAYTDAAQAVRDAIAKAGLPAMPPVTYEQPLPTELPAIALLQQEADHLVAYVDWIAQQNQWLKTNGEEAFIVAQLTLHGIVASPVDIWVNRLMTNYILLVFTGVLLFIIGMILYAFATPFVRQWRKNPVFSTFIALLLLMVVQIYSMKFNYSTFAEWGRFWLDNTFNVLRANTSVGMIALGMTMVIITGGIDLAVGSTLAGVGTVVMVLVDTSPRGILGKLGYTGTSALVLGAMGGFIVGALLGALIGLAVTKGRVPPFIITLGVMNIVRSIAQYATKSYAPKVPSEFTVVANTVIMGQRLLPILYWLLLALIFYVVMKRTRFGRYVYAVGSNERTTRLSGINVERVKFMVYTIMGMLVAIASIVQVSRLGGMDAASAGSGYELDAIAAVVVGGTSMSGGKGSIVGTVIGVLIIGVMNNLLILLGVDSFLTNAFKGAIVVAAVLMQRKEQRGV